ncbi:MAG: DUF885 family protein [Gammaproteobacteria bacterium]
MRSNPLFSALIPAVLAGFALLWGAPLCHAHSDDLNAFFEEAWQADLAASPVLASNLGDTRYNALWPDLSPAAIAKRHASDRTFLARARRLKANQSDWDEHDELNLALFEQTYERRVNTHRYRMFLQPLNQRGGIQSADQIAQQMRFNSTADYENWVARLNAFDTYMAQTIALMRMGITEKRTHPTIIMQRVPEQIEAQLVAPEDSGFFAPFKNMPASISASEQKALRSAGLNAVNTIVLPAYRKMLAFFNDEYLPACRDTVGAWALPDGSNFYAQRAQHYTTTELTPDEIHDIGLSEVKRIRAAMQTIIDDVEFEGSFAEFLDFLRTDKQFYFDNADDLLREYRATSKRIDPELVKLFKRLPRMPYGVKPIPDAIAPDTTTAYYSRPAADGSRAGFYFVNLYRPEVRPKYEIEVLTVHEAMPGHHLQIALAQELGDLPAFRRFGGYTAFVEGWGLYSESLGDELGLYKDPYSKFGQLTYEMWRAVRLVVDTGMHHKRWSRDKAIAFFEDNAAKAKHDIVNEIDRYIAWPGQALAYKIGELKIQELRRRAEAELGDKFDVRDFHEVVLGSGGVPLDILSDNVDTWLNSFD